ncbi:MAG: hypothetical protein V3U84_09635, partial [Thiotrichaceae bacterium]
MQSKLFRRFQFTFVLFAIGFILACSSMDAIAAHENLLKNPGAETGDLTGWIKGVGYFSGSQSKSISSINTTVVIPKSGSSFFMVRGPSGTKEPHIYQEVDISAYTDFLAKGVKVTAQVYANRSDTRDNLVLNIQFMGADGKRIGKPQVKKAVVQRGWQLIKQEALSVPEATKKIRFFLVGKITGSSSVVDAYFDNASLTLTLPHLGVDKNRMQFDNLYQNQNSTTKTYNDAHSRKIRIENTGNGPDALEWNLTVPADSKHIVSVSPTSGSLMSGRSQELTVKLNPPLSAVKDYSLPKPKSFQITSNNVGELSIPLNATVFGTPTTKVTETTPPRISGTVHIALNDQPHFKVSSANPLFPNAKIAGYQWQTVVKGQTPTDGAWQNGPKSGERNITFADSAGEFTVFARMKDNNSNGVGSRHVAIPVHVWNRPTVNKAPPKTVSWLKGKYVGVVGQALKVQASGTSDSGSVITEFHWYQNQSDTEPLVTQKNNQTAEYTPDKQNLSGNL